MPEILRPTIATPITIQAFSRAVQVAWPSVEPEVPCVAERAACLWAQYIIETGGKHCYNWNFGNVKDAEGDGYDFCFLRGVWEGVTVEEAIRLCARREAEIDPDPRHHAQVGARTLSVIGSGGVPTPLPILNAISIVEQRAARVDPVPENHRGAGRVSVVFQPPHAACRFRSYPNLDTAMTAQLSLLKRRYGSGWEGVLGGNVDLFAKGLKLRGYFTATAEAYASLLRPNFRAYLASGVHVDAQIKLAAERSETIPAPAPVESYDLTVTRGRQAALAKLGFDPGPIDGIEGPKTRAAVKAFQRMKGLPPDGIVGPVTRRAIAAALVDLD